MLQEQVIEDPGYEFADPCPPSMRQVGLEIEEENNNEKNLDFDFKLNFTFHIYYIRHSIQCKLRRHLHKCTKMPFIKKAKPKQGFSSFQLYFVLYLLKLCLVDVALNFI